MANWDENDWNSWDEGTPSAADPSRPAAASPAAAPWPQKDADANGWAGAGWTRPAPSTAETPVEGRPLSAAPVGGDGQRAADATDWDSTAANDWGPDAGRDAWSKQPAPAAGEHANFRAGGSTDASAAWAPPVAVDAASRRDPSARLASAPPKAAASMAGGHDVFHNTVTSDAADWFQTGCRDVKNVEQNGRMWIILAMQ